MKPRHRSPFSVILLTGLCFATSGSLLYANVDDSTALLPQPVQVSLNNQTFHLTNGMPIRFNSPQLHTTAVNLQHALSVPTGFTFPLVEKASSQQTDTAINLRLLDTRDPVLGTEGYRLDVTSADITIQATQPAGIFYGIQTLKQLLPVDIESRRRASRSAWPVAGAHIMDYPRFAWRGLLLDVARHFFSKEVVKDLIDQMARRKLNVLHLHLTDDQGWRIEIKSHPELTEVGAWHVPRTGEWRRYSESQPGEKATEGGFYTQDDIRELVAYAQERHVTILPEIEMPGHSLAMIAANPDLSCLGVPYEVASGRVNRRQGERDNVLCLGNERIYAVIEDVISEVAPLFPGKYLHLGGDESSPRFWQNCPKDQMLMKREHITDIDKLQGYFSRRVEKVARRHGKKLIGWDEIADDGLSSESAIMVYRPNDAIIRAVNQGHPVVIADYDHYYLNMCQGTPQLEPTAHPRPSSLIRLIDTYSYQAVPAGVDDSRILGGEGCLWTEKVVHYRQMQYMIWPRALALAERFWSQRKDQDWPDFARRMARQLPRLEVRDVKYAPSAFEPIIETTGEAPHQLIRLKTEIPGVEMHYTFDGSDPDQYYPRYTEPLTLPPDANEIRVVSFWHGQRIGRQLNHTFFVPEHPGLKPKPPPTPKTVW